MAGPEPAFKAIRYLPTTEAYDRWASVYDTDGNFLQALDDKELKTLFPRFLSLIDTPKPWNLIDLGCGTGRNTPLLVAALSSHHAPPNTQNTSNQPSTIRALDASQGMLEVAKTRLAPHINNRNNNNNNDDKNFILTFSPYDLLSETPDLQQPTADAIISTLVLEHIPLSLFFSHVASLLRPGGLLLLTNMHGDMGQISQAGFVDTATGEKIRPTSYAHEVRDVVVEAGRWGLDVVRLLGEREGEGKKEKEKEKTGDGIKEVAVTKEMVGELGARSEKWVGVYCWFGGVFRKR